jgi:hypothetical protein
VGLRSLSDLTTESLATARDLICDPDAVRGDADVGTTMADPIFRIMTEARQFPRLLVKATEKTVDECGCLLHGSVSAMRTAVLGLTAIGLVGLMSVPAAMAAWPSCGCEHPTCGSCPQASCGTSYCRPGCCHGRHCGRCCCCCDRREKREAPRGAARGAQVPSGPVVESMPMMRAVPAMMAMPMMPMMMGQAPSYRAVSFDEPRNRAPERSCEGTQDRIDELDARVEALNLRMKTIQRAVEIQTRILEELKAQGTIGNRHLGTPPKPVAENGDG